MLEYRILGPVEVADETGPISLGGQRQRALLGLLLLNAGRVVSTDRIVDQLWGEEPPKAALASLQNFVSQLRRLLGAHALLTKRPGYLLQVEPAQLDLLRFERLVTEARAEPAERRSQLLREALSLWRGPPLADLAFETFVQTEVRRLEELRLGALEERIDADLELGGRGELVGELEGLVAEHPMRERLRGQLMLALYRAGRQAEALQAYHDARQALVEELGLEPSPPLHQLYRSILRQEAALERAPREPVAEDHFGDVASAMLAGRLVLVLGAGVIDAREGDGAALPSPPEVLAHLVKCFDCPPAYARDLPQAAEYIGLTKGIGPLHDELHALFDGDYAPGPTHHLLAGLAGLLRMRDVPRPLIVTTSFDQMLERAFALAGEEVDIVSHLALGRYRGKFVHVTPDGTATLIEVPNAYGDLSLDRRTVVLKILGGIDQRPERAWESFVVSEDDHIDYLAQAEITVVLPVTLAARLRRSHFLFLGYPLHEWSLRVFLHRVWGREKVAYRSWAIGPTPDAIEQEHWRQRGIDCFDMPLEEYLSRLRGRIEVEAHV
ncbi:MAG TPA: BTAD domain-containing putative transcriptional regulator [Gaiellaceae bacterium]|nr:BTAD domain-containing putative transcriptional regulator [Gaiellaceae bacterium]